MSPPFFTVIIPAYNAMAYLHDCVQSVMNQSDADFEVIVVDDGSTDGTAAVLEPFLTDPRVTLIRQENRGLAAARNAGIWQAQGEWVAFLDADDRWCPEKLATHRPVLVADPTLAVSYDCSVFVDQEGHRTGLRMAATRRRLTPEMLLLKNYLGNGSTAIVRRRVLVQEGGFDGFLPRMVDQELWVRLAGKGYRFQCVPGILTEYRIHPQSLTADTDRMMHGLERFLRRVALYAPELVSRQHALVRAFTYRWMARAAFVARDYGKARQQAWLSLQSSPQVLWRDPRALITFGAIAVQALLPPPLFERLQRWVMAIITHPLTSSPPLGTVNHDT